MSRRAARQAPADPEPETTPSGRGRRRAADAPTGADGGSITPAAFASVGSLADLPVAGLTRRRIALLIGAVLAAWVIVLLARQVSEASAAAGRLDAMRASNAALETQIEALTLEKQLIESQAYIEQQAREYRLGTTREIPFILADNAPPLPPDAPGSAAVKLGAPATHRTPLDSWLDVLFGPTGGSGGSGGSAGRPATSGAAGSG